MARRELKGGARMLAVRSVAATTVVGAVLTVAIALVPMAHFPAKAPAVVDVLQTAVTVIGAGVAVLLWARYRVQHSLRELVLVVAVVTISVAHPAFDFVIRHAGDVFARSTWWGPTVARLIAALLLGLAAHPPVRSHLWRRCSAAVTRSRRARALVVLGPVALTLVTTVLLEWVAPARPPLGAAMLGGADLTASPVFATLQLVTAGGFVVAGWRFVWRADAEVDRFFEWAGVACVLAAFASVNYMIFPTISSEWVYSGDAFRAASCLAWFVAGVYEITACQSEIARLAALEERRRIARDLHDGAAQELAFIAAQAKLLLSEPGYRELPALGELAAASERALYESRRAINSLTRRTDKPLEMDLTRTAEEVARRSGTSVRVEVEGGVVVDLARRETLVRIVREAVNNATRHGRARNVAVELSGRGEVTRLQIADDGAGFDPARPQSERHGFGLLSMRERAEAAGAAFRLDSAPGRGTTIEVQWE